MDMEEILASIAIKDGRTIHVATLSKQTLIEAGVDHMGCEGYFLFEVFGGNGDVGGISILGKMPSFEAALRLADIFSSCAV
jgi:hypothetical protein